MLGIEWSQTLSTQIRVVFFWHLHALQQILTIGHSTHSFEKLLRLLKTHQRKRAICDVRSAPYSRMNPQFNRESFAEQLRENGIAYIYLGMELGGRTEDTTCYEGKRVRYDRLAQRDVFQSGLRRVVEDSTKYRLCLLCAEKEPLECHRTLLVSRHLAEMGLEIQHILADGELESHNSAIERLLEQLKLPSHDLFRTHQEVIKDAYLSLAGPSLPTRALRTLIILYVVLI
jgi:uncharacterized protein (DUF488 family)